MGEATISEKTRVSLGTVIVIIAAAISWGVMYEKVVTIEKEVGSLTLAVSKLTDNKISAR